MFSKPCIYYNNHLRTSQEGSDGTVYASCSDSYAHLTNPNKLYGNITKISDLTSLDQIRGMVARFNATGNEYHITESVAFPGNPKNFALQGITFSDNLYVAVGLADGTDAYLITSPDGIVWTEQANPKNFGLHSVVNVGSLFVAVGWADGTDAYIITSADGIIWYEQANSKNAILWSVIWDAHNAQYVSVGTADGADGYIVTSPDGAIWTEQANPKNKNLYSVVWSGTQYVAVGEGDGVDTYIVTSPDGVVWTEQANPKNKALFSVVWSGAQFVAVGDADGVDGYIITSPDGVNWTEQTNPQNKTLDSIVWSGTQFVAVGDADGTDGYIITSPDGVNWTERANPQPKDLNAVVYFNGLYIAVGAADGTDAYITISDDGQTWPDHNRVLTFFERFLDIDKGDGFTIIASLMCDSCDATRPAFHIADGSRAPRMLGTVNTGLYLRSHAPNLIQDGGFESGVFLPKWTAEAGWTVISSADKLEGAYSANWDLVAAKYMMQTSTEEIKIGKTYTILFKAKSKTANPTIGAITVTAKQTGTNTDIDSDVAGYTPAITTAATWFTQDITADFSTDDWYVKFLGDHTKANGATAVVIDEVYVYEKKTINSLILGYHNLVGKTGIKVNAWRLSPLRSTASADANNKVEIGSITVATKDVQLSTLTTSYFPIFEMYIPATAGFTPQIGEAYIGDYWQLPVYQKSPFDPYRTNSDRLREFDVNINQLDPSLRTSTIEDFLDKLRDNEAIWYKWDTENPLLMESPNGAREASYEPRNVGLRIKLVERL